jgi:ribosomal protein L12E/L44/L45/RPP1/RPP2
LLVKSVTDLEIDEAIRDAWRIVQGGSASASPRAHQKPWEAAQAAEPPA